MRSIPLWKARANFMAVMDIPSCLAVYFTDSPPGGRAGEVPISSIRPSVK